MNVNELKVGHLYKDDQGRKVEFLGRTRNGAYAYKTTDYKGMVITTVSMQFEPIIVCEIDGTSRNIKRALR